METNTEHTSEATVHTHIGREGVIVECRPIGQEYASETDMAHLTDEQAASLRDQLDEYLAGDSA